MSFFTWLFRPQDGVPMPDGHRRTIPIKGATVYETVLANRAEEIVNLQRENDRLRNRVDELQEKLSAAEFALNQLHRERSDWMHQAEEAERQWDAANAQLAELLERVNLAAAALKGELS